MATKAKEKVVEEAEEVEQPQGPQRGLLREYFESAIVTFIMAIFFMTFVAQAAGVPSASMQNTIYVGDHFLINKFIFAPGPPAPFLPQREVRRGDIIVFKYPAADNPDPEVVRFKTYFIKRVIALPGETVRITNGRVFVNGKPLDEPYVRHRASYDLDQKAIPPGAYFVLGDNRPNSSDSHLGWLVPTENIIGKAWVSYWPPTYWGVMSAEAYGT
jgi:signal peptidase I